MAKFTTIQVADILPKTHKAGDSDRARIKGEYQAQLLSLEPGEAFVVVLEDEDKPITVRNRVQNAIQTLANKGKLNPEWKVRRRKLKGANDTTIDAIVAYPVEVTELVKEQDMAESEVVSEEESEEESEEVSEAEIVSEEESEPAAQEAPKRGRGRPKKG